MRVGKNYREMLNSRIKIRVVTIDGDKITGKHETSNLPVTAICTRDDIEIHVGQVIEVEYMNTQHIHGYVVKNSLMKLTSAKVLMTQHIIEGDRMYVSLVMESTDGNRIHSLIPDSMNAFRQATLLIPGDKVTINTNNGNLVEILL